MIASIQTFGSFANFHPHVHALITDGVVTADGTFLSLIEPDLEAVTELLRRLLLAALRRAGRLSEAFHERLLGWSPSKRKVWPSLSFIHNPRVDSTSRWPSPSRSTRRISNGNDRDSTNS